jgi:phage terminase small subunit
MDIDKELTPKQRAFVFTFVKENGRMTPTDCAKQSGYSEHSATQMASNLRNPKMFPKVVEAIEYLQKEYAEASRIDFVKHARELARLREMAVDNGQLGPAIVAEYRRGQLAGFYVDRKEVVTASLDNMSRVELEAKLKEVRNHNVINGESIGVEIEYTDATEVAPELKTQTKPIRKNSIN